MTVKQTAEKLKQQEKCPEIKFDHFMPGKKKNKLIIKQY